MTPATTLLKSLAFPDGDPEWTAWPYHGPTPSMCDAHSSEYEKILIRSITAYFQEDQVSTWMNTLCRTTMWIQQSLSQESRMFIKNLVTGPTQDAFSFMLVDRLEQEIPVTRLAEFDVEEESNSEEIWKKSP